MWKNVATNEIRASCFISVSILIKMATARVIREMECFHDILGEHEFDLSKEPMPLNEKRVKEIQRKIMLMGAGKTTSDPQEAAEFMLYR